MVANPSISFPEWLLIEIDSRRESTTPRSHWVQEAVMARIIAEDGGVWETPEVEQPNAPVPDGGYDG